MIYLFYGTNKEKRNEASRKFLLSFPTQAGTQEYDEQNVNLEEVRNRIQSVGLFDPESITILRGVLEDKKNSDFWKEEIKNISASSNHFVFVETEIQKDLLATFKKYAKKAEEFSVIKSAKKFEFNVFSLADAFASRDKKRTWVLYTQTEKYNVEAEQIHGILFWQIKALILASVSKSVTESGLNPFVYKKSLAYSKKFTEEELKSLSKKLTDIYHDARKGITELPVALEKFILSSL